MRALDVATKALARRDFTERGLRERLERAGIDRDEAERVLARLRDEGIVNEARFAANRANALAERGQGDADGPLAHGGDGEFGGAVSEAEWSGGRGRERSSLYDRQSHRRRTYHRDRKLVAGLTRCAANVFAAQSRAVIRHYNPFTTG